MTMAHDTPQPPGPGFDCRKVDCGGECCGMCPVPVHTWRERQADVQGEVLHAVDDGKGYVHAVTTEGNCPFKRPSGECAIYPKPGEPDPRNEICAIMGGEGHPLMTCPYMDRNGRLRSRGERRQVYREAAAANTAMLVKCRMRYEAITGGR